jgi:hypothetical protein
MDSTFSGSGRKGNYYKVRVELRKKKENDY